MSHCSLLVGQRNGRSSHLHWKYCFAQNWFFLSFQIASPTTRVHSGSYAQIQPRRVGRTAASWLHVYLHPRPQSYSIHLNWKRVHSLTLNHTFQKSNSWKAMGQAQEDLLIALKACRKEKLLIKQKLILWSSLLILSGFWEKNNTPSAAYRFNWVFSVVKRRSEKCKKIQKMTLLHYY